MKTDGVSQTLPVKKIRAMDTVYASNKAKKCLADANLAIEEPSATNAMIPKVTTLTARAGVQTIPVFQTLAKPPIEPVVRSMQVRQSVYAMLDIMMNLDSAKRTTNANQTLVMAMVHAKLYKGKSVVNVRKDTKARPVTNVIVVQVTTLMARAGVPTIPASQILAKPPIAHAVKSKAPKPNASATREHTKKKVSVSQTENALPIPVINAVSARPTKDRCLVLATQDTPDHSV